MLEALTCILALVYPTGETWGCYHAGVGGLDPSKFRTQPGITVSSMGAALECCATAGLTLAIRYPKGTLGYHLQRSSHRLVTATYTSPEAPSFMQILMTKHRGNSNLEYTDSFNLSAIKNASPHVLAGTLRNMNTKQPWDGFRKDGSSTLLHEYHCHGITIQRDHLRTAYSTFLATRSNGIRV